MGRAFDVPKARIPPVYNDLDSCGTLRSFRIIYKLEDGLESRDIRDLSLT